MPSAFYVDTPEPLPSELLAALLCHFPDGSPGAALGVLRAGRCYAGGAGLASLDPAIAFTPHSPFRACSITKQFVALLLLQLAAEGRLSLDDAPGKHVPALRGLDARLRLWHLAQNRSGLPDYWCAAMLTGAQPETPFPEAAGRDLITRLSAQMFPPGAGTRYNNGNFRILQWVLEAVTGAPLSALLQARIWDPLGMRASYLGEDTAQPLDGMRGFRASQGDRPGAWEEEITRIVWSGDAGMVTTLHDLLRWEAALLGYGPVRLPQAERLGDALPRPDGSTASYAFGLNSIRTAGRRMHWHSGALRGFRMMHPRFPEDGSSVVLLMNRTQNPMPLALSFAAVLGLQPAWDRPQPATARGKNLPQGALWCPALDLVAETAGGLDAPTLNLGMDAQPLVWTGPQSLASADGFLHVTTHAQGLGIESRSQGWRDDFAMLPVEDIRPQLAGRRFENPRLGSHVAFGSDGDSLYFTGPRGRSLRYAVRPLGQAMAAFDCPRALDEPPPGRFHLRLDGDRLHIGCLLAGGPDLCFHAAG